MELCTCRAISNLPRCKSLPARKPNLHSPIISSSSIIFKKASIFPNNKSGLLKLTTPLLRATPSENDSVVVNGQPENVTGVVATIEEPSDEPIPAVDSDTRFVEVPTEESPVDKQFQLSEFMDKFNLKLDTEDTYSVLIYGSGALIALWLTSAVIGAIDSIPVFPKVLEIVGLSYTVWFSTRYLLFKKNRDELAIKVEEIKQEIIGSTDD